MNIIGKRLLWDISLRPTPAEKKKLVYGMHDRTIGDIETRVNLRGGHTRAGCVDAKEFEMTVLNGPVSIRLVLFYTEDHNSPYSKDYRIELDESNITLSTLLYAIHALYRQGSPVGTQFRQEIFRGLEDEGIEDDKHVYSVIFQ